jgi:hypothetical protein
MMSATGAGTTAFSLEIVSSSRRDARINWVDPEWTSAGDAARNYGVKAVGDF